MSISTCVRKHSICELQLKGTFVTFSTVGDCLVGPDVLLHRLTDSRYRDFLLHGLAEQLEDVPLTVRGGMCYMLCEMFSITPIMTDGQVQEDPLHGIHARQI
jgi:hypothetical protein